MPTRTLAASSPPLIKTADSPSAATTKEGYDVSSALALIAIADCPLAVIKETLSISITRIR
jgi:hypothetical protein